MKSNRMVLRQICRSLFSLQVQPNLLLPCSGIRLQRKYNQNKHLFAPPLRRFLNYRVGPPGLCARATGHNPASCSEVRGQNLRRAYTNQSKKQRQALTTPTSQSGMSARFLASSASNFKVFSPVPSFSLQFRSVLDCPQGSFPQASVL